MHITPIGLTRFAAAAAVAAGLIFIGVQVGHPPLDAETITTTEMAIRSALKALMAALALVGITGMYLRQVEETGLLGLVGYLLFAAGYLLMLGNPVPLRLRAPDDRRHQPRLRQRRHRRSPRRHSGR